MSERSEQMTDLPAREDQIHIPKLPCNVVYFIDTDEISTQNITFFKLIFKTVKNSVVVG